ncbi:MAG: DNA translocase FtsK [Bacteroidia bacterium]|nr:DNA translocase FtsK [Bacteroidia bacterium]
MRRKNKHNAQEAAPTPKRSLDAKRKLDIIGMMMMVLALLLLLAFVSHSHADETVADVGMVDFLRLFGGDPEIQARADTTSNWLGLFGAIIANFFINITVGYFSIAFPILLMLWGWSIFRRRDLRTLAYYTNYSLVLVLLLSAFLGLLRLISWMPDISVSWSGNIGDFVAGLISRLIGTTGGIIIIFATIVILAVVAVDYDIQASLDRVRNGWRWVMDRIGGKATTLQAAFQTEREALASELRESPAASSVDAPPAVVKSKKTASAKGDVPEPSPVVLQPLQRQTQVSIARPWSADAPSDVPSYAVDDAGTPRSNGTISRDAIDGLREIFGPAPDAAAAAGPVAASTGAGSTASAKAAGEATERVREKNGATPRLTDHGSDTLKAAKHDPPKDDPDIAADIPLSSVMLNEHERKAVQQAVARKVMQSEADEDIDSINQKLAKTRLEYTMPPPDLLDPQRSGSTVSDAELRLKADQVKEKLAVFGIGITSISVAPGPVVTLFELVPDSSVKISKIVSLADDLALALAARGIRIIAPIPGKSAVGIEIPNNQPEIVGFRSVVTSPEFQRSRHKLTLGMGKSINGTVVCDDLAKMPHLLIAGATGSGKSVGINVMITSLLYRMRPQDVKFVMIDPKKIELAQYRGLNRHFLAVCADIDEEIITDPANAVIVLKSLELEMDMRYTKLAKAGVRHVDDYNEKVKTGQLRDSETLKHYQLPCIVVIIDELADLMITAAREVEEPIARLAQLARAVGIHLVVATQRPSVDVITGVIKANFPARVAFQVASRIDSRTVLDTQGAEQLLGNGDMLFVPGGHPKPVRIQNAYLSTAEVERVVEFISEQQGFQRPYTLPSVRALQKTKSRDETEGFDDLVYEAARLIVRHQQGSVSLLQRRLKIGYSRAARIVDQLETVGIVGPYDGSKARQVMVEDESTLESILQEL